MRRRGFSLIELTMVLLIAGIVAGAVVVRLHDPMRRAELADVLDRTAHLDRLTRTAARRHDKALRLVVDLTAGEIRQTDTNGEQGLDPLKLPSRWRIERLIVSGRVVRSGSVSIACSRTGRTPSYAMLVTGPGDRSRWLLLAGLTGRRVEKESEEDVRAILAAAGLRPDAR